MANNDLRARRAKRKAKPDDAPWSDETPAITELQAELKIARDQLLLRTELHETLVKQRDDALMERNDARKQAQSLKEELMTLRMALHGVEVDLQRARTQADAMRQIAFPKAPLFPWEH